MKSIATYTVYILVLQKALLILLDSMLQLCPTNACSLTPATIALEPPMRCPQVSNTQEITAGPVEVDTHYASVHQEGKTKLDVFMIKL